MVVVVVVVIVDIVIVAIWNIVFILFAYISLYLCVRISFISHTQVLHHTECCSCFRIDGLVPNTQVPV